MGPASKEDTKEDDGSRKVQQEVGRGESRCPTDGDEGTTKGPEQGLDLGFGTPRPGVRGTHGGSRTGDKPSVRGPEGRTYALTSRNSAPV